MLDIQLTVNDVTYDAIDDWNCFPKRFYIGEAKPKINLIDIPYGNGSLDVSTALGEMTYNNRKITVPMTIVSDNPMEVYSTISDLISGQITKLSFNKDPDWYYEGRLRCGELQTQQNKWTFEISGSVFPFKYAKQKTVYNVTATSSGTSVTVNNDRMTVCPTFKTTTSGSVTVTCGDVVYTFNTAGEHQNPAIMLKQGNTAMTVKGSNIAVKIIYQKGRL